MVGPAEGYHDEEMFASGESPRGGRPPASASRFGEDDETCLIGPLSSGLGPEPAGALFLTLSGKSA